MSGYRWNKEAIAGADPLVKWIADNYQGPRGKDPGAWFGGIDTWANEYLNSLTPEKKLEAVKNYNPAAVKKSFEAVYGYGPAKVDAFERGKIAYDSYKNALGKDPAADEFNVVLSKFKGENGIDTGNEYIYNLKKQYQSSPEYLRTQSGQYSNDVNSIFQDLLKRGATGAEIQHFGAMLATKEIDPYELSSFVQALPEYQDIKDTQSRNALNTELQAYDTDFFNKQKEGILSTYTKAGIQNSPALDFAMTNALGEIQKQRGQYMAGLSRSDYENQRGIGNNNYANYMNNYLAEEKYKRDLLQGNLGSLRDRSWNAADYDIQKRDYMNYLDKMNQSQGGDFLNYLNTGLNAINTGANVYKSFSSPVKP